MLMFNLKIETKLEKAVVILSFVVMALSCAWMIVPQIRTWGVVVFWLILGLIVIDTVCFVLARRHQKPTK